VDFVCSLLNPDNEILLTSTSSGLAESPAAEHSGQPEEAVPEISEGGALGEDHEGHTIDPKVSEEGEAEENDDEGSEQDSQQPEEGGPGASEGAPASEGGEDALTKILMNFSRALAKVHESTKKIPRDQVKLTETIEKINEAVVRIERNSEHLNIRLAAVEANTAAIQTSMQAIQEKNRLHETGTHVISIRTTELGK
jgi:hypothetical protein